jgi:ABC-type branched-subunit amino acid transport system ATPase component/branched-subunit amino acid ABC-type transport system permease component
VNTWITFAVIGLGIGALYGSLGVGVVIAFKGSGVINFATATSAAWGAFTFAELRNSGNLVLPVFGIQDRVHLPSHGILVSLLISLCSSAVVGLMLHFLVFRPLCGATTLAKVVASVGAMIVSQGVLAVKFGSETRTVATIFPDDPVIIFGSSVPKDRLMLGAVTLVIAIMCWAWFSYTRTGLAVRGASENELAASLAALSPHRLAAVTWILATVSSTLVMILVSPVTGLNATTSTLLIVPALAVALVGRLTSVITTAVAGLMLGCFQSVVTQSTQRSWFPSWAIPGHNEVLPFLLIVSVLFFLGRTLPSRGAATRDRLPEVIIGARSTKKLVAAVMAASTVILATEGSYRFAVITSMIGAIIALSLVVLTGLVGQISLAQAAIAGTAGFVLSKVGGSLPFPFDLLISASVAMLLGVLVGIPALRIRGAQLAVVTMAAAVAIEQLLFRNPAFSPAGGNQIRQPSIFGLDLGVRRGTNIARAPFAFLVLALLVATCLVVKNLMVSTTGTRFLAVRANERAAASVGINVSATKLIAFAFSSFIAGIGGALMGYSRGQLSADSFGLFVGVSFLAFAYLGGISSISGALLAGTFIPLGINYLLFTHVIGRYITAFDTYYFIIGGVGLIAAARTNPDGMAGAAHRKKRASTVAHRLPDPTLRKSVGPSTERRVNRQKLQKMSIESDSALRVEDLSVRYGGVAAVNNVTLSVPSGRIVGLIGPNGAGKTSFIDAITGFAPSTGKVFCQGVNVNKLHAYKRAQLGMARTWQSGELFEELDIRANVTVGAQRTSPMMFANDIFNPLRHGQISRVEEILGLLGLSGEVNRRPSELSLGHQKLVGVARALAMSPSVLLLDEPAAGLDRAESLELGERLVDIANFGTAILLIDHDMALMFDICDEIAVLEFGSLICRGTPLEIRSDQRVVAAYLGDHRLGNPHPGQQQLGTQPTAVVS